jgi:Tfp pilus assembly protein PilF
VALKDPTAWVQDLSFYMTDEELADTIEAQEPLLLPGSSKVAAAIWVAVVGVLGGAFGAVTVSPAIRRPFTFALYLIVAALLLRALHPLIVRVQGSAVAWLAMFAFFWTSLLGLLVVVGARFDSRWLAYGVSVGGGAFVGMMYGSFPPGHTRNQDAWMLTFLVAPPGAGLAAYLLRHSGERDTLIGAAGAGTLAAGLLMLVVAILLVRLWDQAQGLAELGQLYLHNEAFAPKAVACMDRAIEMNPASARYYDLRATALAQMNETGRALADWDRAAELSPKDPEPYVNRGLDRLRRGAVDDAVRCFESALEREPDHARAHCFLGLARERQGDTTRAFEHYDRAVALAPDDARVHCERSRAWLRRGEHATALKDASRAVKLESRLGLAYAARGHVLAVLGRDDDARGDFQEAIELGVEPSVHEEILRAVEAMFEVREQGEPQ